MEITQVLPGDDECHLCRYLRERSSRNLNHGKYTIKDEHVIKEKWKSWETISAKIGSWFSLFPMSPSFYSWATVVLAIVGFIAINMGHLVLAFVLFGVAGLLDIVDGAIARYRRVTSYRGAFLDGSLDRFVDFFLILSYFSIPLVTPWLKPGEWIAIAVFVALMPSFEVAYANHRKAVDDPEEKRIWRILNRGEMYPLMLAVPFSAIWSANVAGYLLVFWVSLAAITTCQTFFVALRLAKQAPLD